MNEKKPDVRVLIVDDCPLVRGLIRELLAGDCGVQVVGEAANGEEGVQLTLLLKPDLVIMDMEMPVMTGLEAIGAIMQKRPTPIMVVTSHDDARLAYEAVSRGALEVVQKPGIDTAHCRQFVHRIKLLAGVAVIRHITGNRPLKQPEAAGTDREYGKNRCPQVIAIASSLGGARVLEMILSQLPAGFSAPIVVAQHISEGFAGALVGWLDQKTPMEVRMATQAEPLIPGRVFIAPPEYNVQVDLSGKLELLPSMKGDIYHPSCDVLLSSVARVYRQGAVGVILTGMGQDGVRGIQEIKAAGGVTIAQNEQSSLIYNMPRLAIEQGVIDFVAATGDIPAILARVTAR